MKKLPWLLSGLLTLVVMVSFSAFQKKDAKLPEKTYTNYYFKFTGLPGEEDQESKWQELADVNAYNALACDGSVNGCALITTSKTNNHPTEVPVTGSEEDMTPIVSGTVIQVRNLIE